MYVKERTGIHSSLEVALLKIDNMLGEQITAGQLTNIEKAIHAYNNHLDSFGTYLGITTLYIDRHPTASMTNNPPSGYHPNPLQY